jgi:hypothetical protein
MDQGFRRSLRWPRGRSYGIAGSACMRSALGPARWPGETLKIKPRKRVLYSHIRSVLSEVARMAKWVTEGLSYAALRKECLNAVRHWPGCETIGGIQIIRQKKFGFSVRVTLYGTAKRRLADRAMSAVEREMRRRFHLIE